jgi:hypothetical protein
VDGEKLVAAARARKGQGKALANGRSAERLVAVALRRGAARTKHAGIDLESKLATARAQLKAARTRE